MTDIKQQLGAQSFCFRGFKENAVVIEKLKACGVNKIELCAVHADFNDETGFDDIIRQYSEGGVEIVSIGVQKFNNDEAAVRKYFDFAHRAGAKFISANFQPNGVPAAFDLAGELAEEYGIKVAIHNHGGKHWLGNSQMLRSIFAMTGEQIGLCLDTAWALAAGENPIRMIEEFGPRLYGIHVKDFVFDRAGKPEDVVVGTGNLNLAELLSTLQRVNFNGYAVLEYEGDVENPVPALIKCVEAVRAA